MMAASLRHLMPANAFVRGVMALVGGTLGGQLIVMAASPALTRLYTPAMFGVFSVFLGFSAIFGVLATWRYEIAIPQAEEDRAAANIVVLCVALTLGMFCLSALVVYFFRGQISAAFHMEQFSRLLWFVPLFILVIGLYQVFNFWNFRKRRFSTVAKSRLQKSGGTTIVQLAAYTFGSASLLAGSLLGQLVAGVYLLFRSRDLFRHRIETAEIRRNASRFRKYPLFSSGSGVLGAAGSQVPMLMLAALFSPVEAGLYALAFRVAASPSAMVGRSVASVFLPNAADAYRAGTLGELLERVHAVLVRLIVPVVAVLAIIAPSVFAVVFGGQWQEAGRYVQVLTPMLGASFIYSPISTTFGILNRQDAGLRLHICLLAASIGSIWAGAAYFHDVLMAIALYSATRAVIYLAGLAWFHRAAGNRVRDLIKPLIVAAIRTAPIVAPLLVWVFLPVPVWAMPLLGLICVGFAWLYYRPLLEMLRHPRVAGAG